MFYVIEDSKWHCIYPTQRRRRPGRAEVIRGPAELVMFCLYLCKGFSQTDRITIYLALVSGIDFTQSPLLIPPPPSLWLYVYPNIDIACITPFENSGC